MIRRCLRPCNAAIYASAIALLSTRWKAGTARWRSEEHRLNSSHSSISTLSLHDALPICSPAIVRLGTIKEVARFQEYLRLLGLSIPCDNDIQHRNDSPLLATLQRGDLCISNRIAINPMEGWDGTLEIGRAPSELQSQFHLHSFPTRRSSDLFPCDCAAWNDQRGGAVSGVSALARVEHSV